MGVEAREVKVASRKGYGQEKRRYTCGRVDSIKVDGGGRETTEGEKCGKRGLTKPLIWWEAQTQGPTPTSPVADLIKPVPVADIIPSHAPGVLRAPVVNTP